MSVAVILLSGADSALIAEAGLGGALAEAHGTFDGATLLRTYVMALGPTVDLRTANKILSIGRSTGYRLAKQGEYPCKVLRLGDAYRVVTADLQRVLELEREAEASDPAAPPARITYPPRTEAIQDRCCHCGCRCRSGT